MGSVTMRTRVLLAFLALAFGLNAWLGDRIPVGLACPRLISPAAVTVTGGMPCPTPVRPVL